MFYNNELSLVKCLMFYVYKIALLGYEFEVIVFKEFEI